MITLEDNTTVGIWEFMNSSLDDCSDRTRVEQIALAIVFVSYTIIGILGNALVLVSIIRIRHWSGLEKAMMCFLTNLAISDFLLCLITFPATAISALHNTWVMGINMCWIVGFAVSYLRIVSILFMMWIGVHRAFVIKYPFSKKITRRIARVISVGVWVIATIPQLTCYLGISPMHYDPDRAVCLASMISDNMLPVMVYALVFIVIPMGTIIGVYSLLLYIAIGAVRRTKCLTELQNNDNETRRRGMSVAHRRAFGTVFAQIGGFLLCFLPFVIFVGLSSIDKNIIPTRLQVYGACSSSMSAIINPIIYMNTNKTFKKFVVNLLKCKQLPNSANSTAVVSQCRDHYKRLSTGSSINLQALRDLYQNTGVTTSHNESTNNNPAPTFRNPSAVADTRIIRNSTCPVGYNQNGPKFIASSGMLTADRGYRRSKSEVAVPRPNLLHPQTNRSRARAANKRITLHGFQAPECPESNERVRLSADSDVSSDYDKGSDNGGLTATLRSADMPASKTKKTARITFRVRSQSDGSINLNSPQGENGTLVSRSLDSFTDNSSGIKPNNRVNSPEFEFRNFVDFATDPMSVVKPGTVPLVSADDDTSSDDGSFSREIDMKGHDNPAIALSPVENPEKMNPESIELNGTDYYNREHSSEKEFDNTLGRESDQGLYENNNASIACSPRISVNMNRWLSNLNR